MKCSYRINSFAVDSFFSHAWQFNACFFIFIFIHRWLAICNFFFSVCSFFINVFSSVPNRWLLENIFYFVFFCHIHNVTKINKKKLLFHRIKIKITTLKQTKMKQDQISPEWTWKFFFLLRENCCCNRLNCSPFACSKKNFPLSWE